MAFLAEGSVLRTLASRLHRLEESLFDREGVWAGDPPQQAAWPEKDAGAGRAAAVCQPAAAAVVGDEARLLTEAG